VSAFSPAFSSAFVPPPRTPGPTIFDPIVTGYDVEGWVMDLLKTWFPTYLSEVERQHGAPAGTWKRPVAWVSSASFDKWPEDQLPAVLVVSHGLAEKPLAEGLAGAYRARWEVILGCIVSARTQRESHTMAMLYIGALRALLVQRPGLDLPLDQMPRPRGVVWNDEDYTVLEYDATRSLAAGAAGFTVEIEGVTSWKAGPTTPDQPIDPDTDPWPPWAVVETVEVELEHEPIGGA
jgi:hypothetical protein